MRIFCDFDGTISQDDTTDRVLAHLADPAWETVEADWTAGRIDAATCMTRQIAMIRAPLSAIDAVLDGVELRDGFADFLGWCDRRGVPFSIVSDGVDYFIQRILRRHGIRPIPLIANRLIAEPSGGWRLEQPWKRGGCDAGSGVCKCGVVAAFEDDRPLVFIGDGRSDFCVATKPDILFATGKLTDFCEARALPHQPFAGFGEVRSALNRIAAPLAVEPISA